MINYAQTGQFSPSKVNIKGTPPPAVLNVYRLFFMIVTVMFI